MENLLKDTLIGISKVYTLKPTFTFWVLSCIVKHLNGLRCPDNDKELKIKHGYFTANGSETIAELDGQEYYITITPKK